MPSVVNRTIILGTPGCKMLSITGQSLNSDAKMLKCTKMCTLEFKECDYVYVFVYLLTGEDI